MKKRGVPESIQAAMVIIGTVIGAGFASGQEVMRFFTGYGVKGLISIALSGLLFIWICSLVFKGTQTEYQAYLETLMPRSVAGVVHGVTVAFTLFSYGAMLAGSGALAQQEMGSPYYTGLLGMAAVSTAILIAGKKGLIWLNLLVVPLMIMMLIWICLTHIGERAVESAYLQASPLVLSWEGLPDLWFLGDGILYISYNLLTLIPVLCTLRETLRSVRARNAAAVLGGGGLMFLSFILGLASLANYDTMKGMEIPLLALIQGQRLQCFLCCMVLWCAMLTTAVSDGYICMEYLCQRGMSRQAAGCIVAGLGIMIGCLGFSSLVGKVYPIFGVLGLGLLAAIIRRAFLREKEQFH